MGDRSHDQATTISHLYGPHPPPPQTHTHVFNTLPTAGVRKSHLKLPTVPRHMSCPKTTHHTSTLPALAGLLTPAHLHQRMLAACHGHRTTGRNAHRDTCMHTRLGQATTIRKHNTTRDMLYTCHVDHITGCNPHRHTHMC